MKPVRSLDNSKGPAAFELIEESVHLLRQIPPGWLALYYLGSAPFALALLYFWAHTTWFQPSLVEIAWDSIGLAALYIIMKAIHAEFCGWLLAWRLEIAPPRWSARRFLRLALAQLRIQPWALLAMFPALLATVPFAWVYAYGQSASVIGAGKTLHQESAEQAKLWPKQNHWGLLLVAGIFLLLCLNFGAAFYAIPLIANQLLGLDNIYNFSGWSYFNTTFLAANTVLAWLAVDPLIKAFYTLRVFHGRVRRTGEDIRLEFRENTRGARPFHVVVGLISIFIFTGFFTRGVADPPNLHPVVQAAQLDHAIDQVLANGEFPWRMHPVAAPAAETSANGLALFFRKGAAFLLSAGKAIVHWASSAVDWISRHLFRNSDADDFSHGGFSLGLQRSLLYGFMFGAAVLIGWLGWLIARNPSQSKSRDIAVQPIGGTTPDLRDDNVQAAQLPVDGWLTLAREKAAAGDWRLALRALYLATLARHAANGLLTLAKFKTNFDYELELRRRALSRVELAAVFSRRRREYEAVWYGHAETGENEVRDWLNEFELPPLP